MALSLRAGLSSLDKEIEAALVVLVDQPQIDAQVVKAVIAIYRKTGSALVVPSYQMHRGHPWLIERSLWPAVWDLQPGEYLRDLLNRYADEITYLDVDTPSVLGDIDTPEDYLRERPDGN